MFIKEAREDKEQQHATRALPMCTHTLAHARMHAFPFARSPLQWCEVIMCEKPRRSASVLDVLHVHASSGGILTGAPKFALSLRKSDPDNSLSEK